MRGTFIKTLAEIAASDERVVLLTADLGFMAIEPFSERFPERFFNVGVAEQNMLGLATGMAEAGLIPFVYSIVPFAVLRPYEFIRNGPLQHQFPVRIVGVGAGLDYSTNGISHYGVDDVGVMRVQPSIRIISPADALQTREALLKTWHLTEPIYYRLGKDDRLIIDGLQGRFNSDAIELLDFGTARSVNNRILILAMGSIASEMVAAVRLLDAEGIVCTAGVVSTLNPTPTLALQTLLRSFDTVITLEAHYITGGLGSMVCEVVAETGLNCQVVRCGIHALNDGITGGLNFMYQRHQISSQHLVASVKRILTSRS